MCPYQMFLRRCPDKAILSVLALDLLGSRGKSPNFASYAPYAESGAVAGGT